MGIWSRAEYDSAKSDAASMRRFIEAGTAAFQEGKQVHGSRWAIGSTADGLMDLEADIAKYERDHPEVKGETGMPDENKKEKPDHPERARLLRAFAEGGTVLHQGRHLRTLGDVPSNEEFEKADETAAARRGQRLMARRDAIERQIAELPSAPERMVSQTSPNVGIGNQQTPPDVPLSEVFGGSGKGKSDKKDEGK